MWYFMVLGSLIFAGEAFLQKPEKVTTEYTEHTETGRGR